MKTRITISSTYPKTGTKKSLIKSRGETTYKITPGGINFKRKGTLLSFIRLKTSLIEKINDLKYLKKFNGENRIKSFAAKKKIGYK